MIASPSSRWLALLLLGLTMVLGMVPLSASSATSAPAVHFEPVTVKVTAQELTKNVWMVKGLTGMASSTNEGFNSNAGFVVTRDGVVVFDALGTPSLGAELLKQIRRITDKPIRRLIISHYHSDHFYGAQAFAQAGVPITAQEWVISNYLKSDAPVARLAERRQSLFPWVNDSSRITPPDQTFKEEESFTIGGLTFRLFHVGPAHTPEDSMMLVEELGVLFSGDLLFAGRLPWVGDADSRAWLAALGTLDKYNPRFLIPGHGDASADARADLNRTRDYLTYLRQAMGKAVDELMEFDEAYRATDWSPFKDQPTFDLANRTNAYNTFLLMQRESLRKKRAAD